jgi:threonine dehydrogenase-like Zn-dependent dehydrogenase
MALTSAAGVDVAIEAVGIPATFDICQSIIAPGGRIANVGVHGKSVEFHIERLCSGPKANYRRTEEMVRQIIRHRFLDPEASAEIIAQKLRQADHLISIRSVERVISDFGLQKKLYAWGAGTFCSLGRSLAGKRSGRGWACTWCTRRRCVSTVCGMSAP